MTQFFKFSTLHAALSVGVIALGASASAQAIVYDFKFSGGAQHSLAFAFSQLFVEVMENSSTPDNDLLFKFTNELSEPQASIVRLYFDTGVYTSLFISMSVWETSGLVNLVPGNPVAHPFLPANFTPDYQIGLSSIYPFDNSKYGINPGEYASLSATLDMGKSFADVIGALNEGLSSTTGLRIGLFTYNLLGDQGRDDAAHVTHSVVAVPEVETWMMMLAGLGLMGFTVHRRKS